MEKEWFKDWFSSPYYDILYYKRNEEEAAAFIHQLINYLQPAAGSYMLDAACGKGRHSRVLAGMGFDVTGIDLSDEAIKEANNYATENLHFFYHDMRRPFYINYFDYAFNFFTSFGYFLTRREHDNAMRTLAQSLKNNGLLIIDYLNTHFVEDHLVKNETTVVNDVVFNITRWHDEDHFFKQIEIQDKLSQKQNEIYTERVAKFSPGDFTDMLAYQKMQMQYIFGDYHLAPYDIRKSPRMIIIAKKIIR
ncbi:class I SAM-dependent methyltransferase [soil metagenome]